MPFGLYSDELKSMLATHFTLSLDQVPTPDDLRMKSREYLLIKTRAQNLYRNYGNYSGTNASPFCIDRVTTCIRGGHVRIVVRLTTIIPPFLLINKT